MSLSPPINFAARSDLLELWHIGLGHPSHQLHMEISCPVPLSSRQSFLISRVFVLYLVGFEVI